MASVNGILIGVDLGGTNVRAGAVSSDGQLLHWQETSIEASLGPESGLRKIAQLVAQVLAQTGQPILALGVGSTGPLDRERGCIQNPYTLPGWEDVNIVSRLQEKFGAPVALENDADAAALGESWVGAGRGVPRMSMVTIGTGVGTALILDGEIYRGLGGEHPEGGHIILDPSGPECYCGARGCWESLVAGPAIAQFARGADGLQSSALYDDCRGDLERIDAANVFRVARTGDAFCLRVVERTAEYMGLGLVSLMMLTLPDCIVLTGGVLRSYDLLEARIRAVVARHDVIIPAARVKIQLAILGQQAGMFGAARAAWLLYSKAKA
ncbi:MAG: ROK family protein [Chloroflexota bacterium]